MKGETEAVAAFVVVVVVVVVADVALAVGIAAQLAVCGLVVVPGMRRPQRPTWRIHEAGVVGSMPGVVGAERPRGPERCRVPCWRDALPWRRV